MSTDPVVVVLGSDAGRVGAVVADLEARGLRAGAFVGDPSDDRAALLEMLAELYADRDDPT